MDKKILTVQDVSCVGQCSLTVALPIISACGIETAILPSAVLSNHTAKGYGGFTFKDLTDEMPKINERWKTEGIKFDALYTGYLGSEKQISYVKDIIRDCVKEGGEIIVDPAMADNGKLYVGFDDKFVRSMASLCAVADVVLPNITEACFITGSEYKEKYDETYVEELIGKLIALGAKKVVLTGVGYDERSTGVMIYENGETTYYKHKKIPQSFHGTGDVYASAFTGALMRGKSVYAAAKIAADYTVRCIENTVGDETHWYGVKFEPVLKELIKAIEE